MKLENWIHFYFITIRTKNNLNNVTLIWTGMGRKDWKGRSPDESVLAAFLVIFLILSYPREMFCLGLVLRKVVLTVSPYSSI